MKFERFHPLKRYISNKRDISRSIFNQNLDLKLEIKHDQPIRSAVSTLLIILETTVY